jgi:protein gp37
MGKVTGIAWTESTMNFWVGCRKVSAGCTHCYAEKLVQDRMRRPFTEVRRTRPELWNQAYAWSRKEGALGTKRPVFTCSLSDFFIEDADPWRDDAWKVVHDTPNLIWQILTKRPERIRSHLPSDWGEEGYPNVWLGTTVENQEAADKRIGYLLGVEAKVRFLSVEPMLGKIDVTGFLSSCACCGISWVICGGESGPGARPMDPGWAIDLRDQVKGAGAAFFFKQWGGVHDKRAHEKAVLEGRTWTELPVVT